MHNRLRLLMGTTALLYFGPLLAGLGGFGWRVVPIFVAVFMLWLFILRPHLWPRRLKDWTRPEALVALAAQGAMQILLVAGCFGIGRGLGGVMGALPPFPLLLPISVSFLSIPLSRLIWNPWQALGLEGVLAADADRVEVPQADPAKAASANALARRLIEPLAGLPPDIDVATLQTHLTALSGHAEAARIRGALLDRAQAGLACKAELKALILHTTDKQLIASIAGNGPTEALSVLPQDPELIELFARRLEIALQEDCTIWPKCPSLQRLSVLAKGMAGTEAEAAVKSLIETLRGCASA